MSVQEASASLVELLTRVHEHGDEIVIEQDGKELGVLISPSRHHRLNRSRRHFWDLIDLVVAPDTQPDEDVAMLIALEAVAEVRDDQDAVSHDASGRGKG